MNFKIVLSIALLAALTATTQGLFVKSAILKKKLFAAASLGPVVGGPTSVVSEVSEVAEVPEVPEVLTDVDSPIEPVVVAEEIPTRFLPRYSTVHAAVPVYSYEPLYSTRVYYTAVRPAVRRTVYARASFGSAGRAIGNLVAGSVRAIADVGSSIKGALSAVQPSTIEASVTTY